jgi:CheY-like chemotaxis protein
MMALRLLSPAVSCSWPACERPSNGWVVAEVADAFCAMVDWQCIQQAQTEEDMIQLAMRMSAMEASTVAHQLDSAEMEEEQLAIALSLSMAEQDRRLAGDSSDEESDDEPTPPSTPYMGQLMDHSPDQAADADGGDAPRSRLPSYDEAFAFDQAPMPHSPGAGPEQQVLFPPPTPGGGAGGGNQTIEIEGEEVEAGIAELESYLAQTAQVGADA